MTLQYLSLFSFWLGLILFLLHGFSLLVFLCLLFDMGNGGAYFCSVVVLHHCLQFEFDQDLTRWDWYLGQEWWVHQGKKKVDAVMHLSCLVPTVQNFGGSLVIWGWFSRSGVGSTTLCALKMRSPYYLKILNDQVFLSMGFFLPWSSSRAWHIPKWQCQGSSGSNCGSGSMRHHFHTWIGHHRVQTFTQLRIFGMCWRRL